MYLGKTTTTYIKDNNGFTIMNIVLDYNPQDETGKPYTISYEDMAFADCPAPELVDMGAYKTTEEAETAYNEIIEAAGQYMKSLFFPVYNFTEYLTFQEG